MIEEYEEHQSQRIIRQNATVDELIKTNARYRQALLLISEWKMPYSGFGFDKGSNGQRDFFRFIATKALNGEII